MYNDQVLVDKISSLKDWSLNLNFPAELRYAEVAIMLQYVDVNSISHFEPKERKKKIDEDQREKFQKLIQTYLFNDYKIIGTSKRPKGIKTRIPFSILYDIEKLPYVEGVIFIKIDGARKKRQKKVQRYFCVKMTAVIEIEGYQDGLQKIEDRFVIIKAQSQDDAYLKLEKQKENYVAPYLNSDGRFVRWRIESFDDSYEIELHNITDLNNPEGVEVYSKFRSRRLKKEKAWDGKIKQEMLTEGVR